MLAVWRSAPSSMPLIHAPLLARCATAGFSSRLDEQRCVRTRLLRTHVPGFWRQSATSGKAGGR